LGALSYREELDEQVQAAFDAYLAERQLQFRFPLLYERVFESTTLRSGSAAPFDGWKPN